MIESRNQMVPRIPMRPTSPARPASPKKTTQTQPTPSVGVRAIVEDLLGCKWSLAVLDAVRSGVLRPGAMERHIEGISKKVLGERLRKLVRYGVVERKDLARLPLHVEYHLTAFGRRLTAVLDAIDRIELER